MARFGSAVCDFEVEKAEDGSHWLIAVRPRGGIGLPEAGQLAFELKPGFEGEDAKELSRMLKDWITRVRFEPAREAAASAS
jgi:hypothetical protein